MIKIYGANTFNPIKVLLTAEELNLEYSFVNLNFAKQEHRTPEYLEMNPLGRVPLLEHDGKFIAESGAICRYLANINDKKLYSDDPFTAAKIDQIVDTFNVHIGRWIGTYFWQEVICKKYFNKDPDPVAMTEAKKNLNQLLPYLDKLLEGKTFLNGEDVSIADTIGFAFFQVKEITSLDVSEYPNITAWYDNFHLRPSVQKVKQLMAG